MGKSSKTKKTKIPKLTEAEYAAYLSSLKDGAEPASTRVQSIDGQPPDENKEKLK